MPGSASSWSLVAELMSSRSALAAVAVEFVDGVLAACATVIPLIMLNAKSTARILVMNLLLIIVSPKPFWASCSQHSARAFSHRRWSQVTSPGPTCLRKKAAGRSVARLAVVRMCAFGFRLGFGHVGTRFSRAVPLRTFAVVDVGRGI